MSHQTCNDDLLTRLEEADALPTPPIVLTQINKVVSDPNTSAYDVAAVVSEDPAMTAKILRMVNSAYYGLSDSLTSVRQAIVILGIEAIRSLVLCAGIVETFSNSDIDRGFHEEFWRHSLMVASAGRVLGAAGVGKEEAFSAGLLHDIGKMIVACNLPSDQARLRNHELYGKAEDRLVEQEVFGIDHAYVGGLLAERWKLPEVLGASIRHHHDLDVQNGDHLPLVRLIHFADYLGHISAQTTNSEARTPQIDWVQASALGYSEDDIPELANRVREEYGRSETFLAMVRA